jgi:hypothetical protein
MNQTAKEKAKEHNDPVVKQEFAPAKDEKEAFKDEDARIQSHGGAGPQNPNTYNKINSPGKKYNEQDKKEGTK